MALLWPSNRSGKSLEDGVYSRFSLFDVSACSHNFVTVEITRFLQMSQCVVLDDGDSRVDYPQDQLSPDLSSRQLSRSRNTC